MRLHKLLPLLFLIISFSACNNKSSDNIKTKTSKIRVAVFEGHGGAQTCIWETMSALSLDPGIEAKTVTTSDIANGVLDEMDVLVVPGGGGSRQYLNLGAENHERIKAFVKSGKGAVGICAGAYLFSNTPEYSCLAINGAQAIDIEHDNRGHGISKFTLNEKGKEIFPELANIDTCYVMYYEGPVFIDNQVDTIQFTELATMQSDVHEEGDAPKNMTNNKPFFICNEYGSGRVFSTIAHPEATPGMMWMIPRMVRWAADKPFVDYKTGAVNPNVFNKEILMTINDLRTESGKFKVFLYGKPEEKVEAMDWLQGRNSWEAKRWVQGLLFDGSEVVRLRAAKYISEMHYLHYLNDLQAAYNTEADSITKINIKPYLDNLKGLR